MPVVDPDTLKLYTDDHPTGALAQRYLFVGDDLTPENFMFSIAETCGRFQMVRHRHSFEQFRFAFANAVSEEEAKELYETFAVPAPGAPLFQAAAANLNPWTEAKVDTENPDRGPLLIISGEKDHTVPWAIANASFHQQQKNPGLTEIVEIKGRGHALTIDSGWREVATTALEFVKRFV